jgi:hypothetical protein
VPADMAPKRRMSHKQRPPAPAQDPFVIANQAIADESWSELVALDTQVRRKHMHWVHVWDDDPTHVQPPAFTREGFYNHLCSVYKDNVFVNVLTNCLSLGLHVTLCDA